MKLKKVIGGKFTTKQANQDLMATVDDGIENNVLLLTNVSICNMGDNEINAIINGGTRIPIDANEILSLEDIVVGSIIVVEQGSTVRFLGLC